ncbi:FecCD family ABC transporter permease [Longispora urticae]
MRLQVKIGPTTFLVRRRSLPVAAALLAVLVLVVLGGLMLGETVLSPADVVRGLLTGDLVVTELRLPRIVLAVVAGAAFGLAGALVQGVTRNPLASPDVIGVTQGAGLTATVALTSGVAYEVIAPFAVLGGLLAAALVLLVGARNGLAAQRFVLAGVAVAMALRALIEVVIVGADGIEAQRAQIWLIGSLNGRGYAEAQVIALALLLALPALLWAGRALDTMALDDDTARAIGVRPVARRIGLALVGVLLAAVAVGYVGAVDFVALVAPQVARRLWRSERPPLLGAALVGAALVVAADTAGRVAFAPVQVPAGVFTAAIGGPYLLYLLLRRAR